MTSNIIHLQKHFFAEKERVLSESDGLITSVFTYETGVHAIRVSNSLGYIIILPYQGQQIWHCRFDDRDLHMKSIFDIPEPTTVYMKNYGGFFLHCGITDLGVPGPTDTFPLHGELPNAPYQKAYVAHGQDEKGQYVMVSGEYTHKMAFNHHYRATPSVKIYQDSSLLDVSIEIANLFHITMDVKYLAHINFRPVDHAKLVYTAPYDPEHVAVSVDVPNHIRSNVPVDDYVAFKQKLKENPALHHTIDPNALYDPEVVMAIKYHSDENGIAHSLQVHPDGYAHYVAHKPGQLDQALRWIARNPNHDAMGLVLPCSSGGGLPTMTLEAGGNVRFDMQMGLLNPDDVQKHMHHLTR